MKYFFKSKIKILLLTILQLILFLIPFIVLMIVYKDTFFKRDTGYGLSGLGLLGLIIYLLNAGRILNKVPKIIYFVFLYVLFLSMSFLADFLVQIGSAMMIGAVISYPMSWIIEAVEIDGKTDLTERSKNKVRKKIQAEEVEIEVK